MGLTSMVVKRSLDVFRKDGLRGLLDKRREYYLSYPPLRKSLYYWLYSKTRYHKEVVKRINGFDMYLNLRDFGLSKQLWINGYREPECFKHFSNMLHSDDVVLEIGANIGYYVLWEAVKASKVYAFEPLPENYDFLNRNIFLNNVENVMFFPWGVSDRKGSRCLFYDRFRNRANMFSGKYCVDVPCVTVDGFCEEYDVHPDVIRMDIEGFEWFVFKGMRDTLKGNVCRLFFEVHPSLLGVMGFDWKVLVYDLMGLGYRPMVVVKEFGPIREESFVCDGVDFIREGVIPEGYDHGFGLFMEKE